MKKNDEYRISVFKGIRRKWLLRINIYILLSFLVNLSLRANEVGQGKLSLNLKNASFIELIQEIESKTELGFIYNQDDIKKVEKINLQAEGISVNEILDMVLVDSGLEYQIDKKIIIVRPAQESSKQKVQKSRSLKGKVSDQDGLPLPGVSVFVKGTTQGIATNFDGEYELMIPNQTKAITFSFIGMQTKEVLYTGQSQMDVILQSDLKGLDEVVVTGFQSISKERVAGSFSIIQNKDLTVKHMPSGAKLLEGHVAGLSTYGDQITLRGNGTFGVSEPLVVIDGFPMEGGATEILSRLNTNDIKSFTVLKDAASASIYGAKSANGVIVITTRKASKDIQVDFNMNLQMDSKPDYEYMNYASASDVIDYTLEYYDAAMAKFSQPQKYFESKQENYHPSSLFLLLRDKAYGKINEAEYQLKISELRKNNYAKEYYDHIYRNTFKQEYNLAVRTAGKKNNFSISLNYKHNKLNKIGNKNQEYNIFMKNILKVSDKLSVKMGINTWGKESETPNSIGGANSFPIYERLLNEDGTYHYLDKIGSVHADAMREMEGVRRFGFNALEESHYNITEGKSQRIRSFIDANLKVAEGLSLNSKFQYVKSNSNSELYAERDSYEMRALINTFIVKNEIGDLEYLVPNDGRLKYTKSTGHSYTFRNQLNYEKVIREDHAINAIIGSQVRETYNRSTNGEIYGYDAELLTTQQMDWKAFYKGYNTLLYPNHTKTLSQSIGLSENKDRFFSAFFNFAYSYKAKYNLTGSWRVDQSNLFGVDPKYKYRPMWSLGAAWNIHNENFMDKNMIFDRLKLRLSYGITGNVDNSTSPLMILNIGNAYYHDKRVSRIKSVPNPQLRWEKTDVYNLGIDFSLMSNRLSGTLDFYYKYSSDLLARKIYDPTNGEESGRVNNGAMSNKGFELSLGYHWIQTKNFSWKSNLICAYNKNRIEKINFRVDQANSLLEEPESFYENKTTYQSLYAYESAGITNRGSQRVYDENGEKVFDKIVSSPDALKIVGQLEPKVNGSLNNVFRYKRLELSAFVIFNLGHKLRRDVPSLALNNFDSKGGIHKDIVKRWTRKNTETSVPFTPDVELGSIRNTLYKYGDQHIESASYVKLRNVALRYGVSKAVAKKLRCNSIHLRAQVNNIAYWSAAGDIDPEFYDANMGTRAQRNKMALIFGLDLNF